MKVSQMTETLIGSEIIKLAGIIKEKIKNGEKIYNLTIGDFDSKIFPIPNELEQAIIQAYQSKETNYPEADGLLVLRKSIQNFLQKTLNLNYELDEILVAGGARPLIFTIFMALLDEGDKVIFPVPSWNNNHYTHILKGKPVMLKTYPEEHFMPIAKLIAPHVKDATLLALCSPLNPTGTVFSKNQLMGICELVLEENSKRNKDQKPLYVMYDQIYWTLTYGNYQHFDPVSLYPEMRPYTIYVDGISKSLAATGVRVGWSTGPQRVIQKMKSLLSHIGAWAPKPEQLATAQYFQNIQQPLNYIETLKTKLVIRLNGIYNGIQSIKYEGFDVDAIEPQAGLYLTVKFALQGAKTPEGKILDNANEVHQYLLNEAKVAMVPFSAFGDDPNSDWYRISVGTIHENDVEIIINQLKTAIHKLNFS
jgi:aspartate aminotransferase